MATVGVKGLTDAQTYINILLDTILALTVKVVDTDRYKCGTTQDSQHHNLKIDSFW